MYSAAEHKYNTDTSLSCGFRLRYLRAKCGAEPPGLPSSNRIHTNNCLVQFPDKEEMDPPPFWRLACIFEMKFKQTTIARIPAWHNAASRQK